MSWRVCYGKSWRGSSGPRTSEILLRQKSPATGYARVVLQGEHEDVRPRVSSYCALRGSPFGRGCHTNCGLLVVVDSPQKMPRHISTTAEP